MKTDLAVIGQGGVTPAGVGVEMLRQGVPAGTSAPLISRPDKTWPVFRVNLNDPALVRWQKESRLRRASAISYFLVEAAEQALAGLSAEQRAATGLIVAFSTGCLAYSRRFFESIIRQGHKAASPALFPETVFNSPVSHVAATLRLEGAAYALAGDDTAWIAALKTAALWLEEERVRQVLVLGAEEFDASTLDAYAHARWLQRSVGFIPGEGAAGVLVRRAAPGDRHVISQLEDGFIYRSKAQARAAGERCLKHFAEGIPCFSTARHNWLHDVESRLTNHRGVKRKEASPYLGEARTASAAWNTLRALAAPEKHLLVPVWGMTHQIAALEMKQAVD